VVAGVEVFDIARDQPRGVAGEKDGDVADVVEEFVEVFQAGGICPPYRFDRFRVVDLNQKPCDVTWQAWAAARRLSIIAGQAVVDLPVHAAGDSRDG
jgi:hypothetical protein